MNLRGILSGRKQVSLRPPVLKAIAVGPASCCRCGTDEKRIYYSRTAYCVDCMFTEFCRLQRENPDDGYAFPAFARVICDALPADVLEAVQKQSESLLDGLSEKVAAMPLRLRTQQDIRLVGLMRDFIAACKLRKTVVDLSETKG
jgi:hypothetical protein